MTADAQRERQALCDTLLVVGPHAPTLCGDWTSADLAAHLIIRERRPLDAAGIAVPALADRTDRAVRKLARETPYATLVDTVRHGPPRWNPMRITRIDDQANLLEFVVHHEDVLRGGGADDLRRDASDDLQAVVWRHLSARAGLLLRHVDAGVVLVTDHARHQARPATAKGTVVLRGRPLELALFCHGRRGVADITIDGPDTALRALTEADLHL
ncbi:TIGR03085 family metal-binding protein [Kribbia dieselivorans]|uniref:TIGR03085 family metal-binding protein n=1 Tax=Kribbia dieselivorans TaxID=331526 RepID=UPI00083928CC|nr:TIGR03085 family metal-binding protein [Kribbia dieselivorans]